MKDLKKCVGVMIKDVYKNSSESHMAGLLGGFYVQVCTGLSLYL